MEIMKIRQLKQIFFLKEAKSYKEFLRCFKNSKNFQVFSKTIFKFN